MSTRGLPLSHISTNLAKSALSHRGDGQQPSHRVLQATASLKHVDKMEKTHEQEEQPSFLEVATHLHHVDLNEVEQRHEAAAHQHSDIDINLLEAVDHLHHLEAEVSNDGQPRAIEEVLKVAERRSQIALEYATDALADAERVFRQSVAALADLDGPDDGPHWDHIDEIDGDDGTIHSREVQPEPHHHQPLGQPSGKQEQQKEDEAVVRDAAATKLGAAARGRSARKLLATEKKNAQIKGEVSKEVSAAVEAKRAEAKAMQEAAQKQLEAARAAVASAHDKLKSIQKQQQALAAKRRSVSDEEWYKIQEALRVAAEERRKKEEAKRLEMEAEEAARLEAEREDADRLAMDAGRRQAEDNAVKRSRGGLVASGMATARAMTTRARRAPKAETTATESSSQADQPQPETTKQRSFTTRKRSIMGGGRSGSIMGAVGGLLSFRGGGGGGNRNSRGSQQNNMGKISEDGEGDA